MGLANKSVVLYESIKIGKKWTLRPVDENSSRFSEGPFYVSWYDGNKKQFEPAGRHAEHALRMVTLKRAALAYISAGGELTVRNPVQKPAGDLTREGAKNTEQNQTPSESIKSEVKNASQDGKSPENRKKVNIAITEYLEDCLDRQGKSGYGLASRTHETYTYRLGFLAKFKPKAFLDEVDDQFVKAFRRFLREQPNLSDRTSYNIMQAVSTFLLRNGIGVAKPILKEMSFPPTEVIPYSDEEMRVFFNACVEKEELLFKFFLHSMGREMEVAHSEVRDLKFDINVLHISPKPDRDFRLKGIHLGSLDTARLFQELCIGCASARSSE